MSTTEIQSANRSRLRAVGTRALAGIVACAAFTSYIPSAHAEEVSGTGKGIAGGALLGAEVVTIGGSIAGVRSPWFYAIGDIVGAGGGGVAGYFVEQGSSDGRAPVYMFAGGLALVIPAIVLTLNATRYHGSEDATEDNAPGNAPAAEPGRVGGSSVIVNPGSTSSPALPGGPAGGSGQPTPSPSPASQPGSLLHFEMDPSMQRSWGLGVPVPEVRAMYSLAEQKALGVPQGAEMRMPVVRVTF